MTFIDLPAANRPSFTQAVISACRAASTSHEGPCPAGRAGRTAATTCPSSSSVSCASSPSRARPAACAALIYRAAVFTSTPARLAAGRFPAPASHARRTSLTCVTRTSRNAIPCRLFQSEMNRKITAGWSINWQTRWSHPRGNNSQRVVPCSWQTTMADSVRAGGAVRGTARFADPRPFCPVIWAPASLPDWRMSRIPVGRFFAVLLAPGGGLALLVPAARAGCRIGPRHLIEAPRGDDSVYVVAARVLGIPGQGWIRRSRSLSWTDDGPVIYLPYTCAGNAPD